MRDETAVSGRVISARSRTTSRKGLDVEINDPLNPELHLAASSRAGRGCYHFVPEEQ